MCSFSEIFPSRSVVWKSGHDWSSGRWSCRTGLSTGVKLVVTLYCASQGELLLRLSQLGGPTYQQAVGA